MTISFENLDGLRATVESVKPQSLSRLEHIAERNSYVRHLAGGSAKLGVREYSVGPLGLDVTYSMPIARSKLKSG